jgi:hypothetical protein
LRQSHLIEVELLAWLTDVLERMVSGQTKTHELERLLPWRSKAEQLARRPSLQPMATRRLE